MCVVSMIGDHFADKWKEWPYTQPNQPYVPYTPYIPPQMLEAINWPNQISREEFDSLKKDVQEMKELLKRAKLYDEKNNEPNCEIEAKMKLLREIAKVVGIDLDDVLTNKTDEPTKISNNIITEVVKTDASFGRTAYIKLVNDKVIFDDSNGEYGPTEFPIQTLIDKISEHEKRTGTKD